MKPRRVPLTAKVLRGLRTAFDLGYADLEAAQHDWTTAAHDDVAAADALRRAKGDIGGEGRGYETRRSGTMCALCGHIRPNAKEIGGVCAACKRVEGIR